MDESSANMPILPAGTCIDGKYVLHAVLGVGGSAVVYEAEQLALRRPVALKVYPALEGLHPSFVARFRQEASLLAQLHHENIVAVYDAGTLPDGSPFLVVQRVRGETLSKRLEGGALPIDEVVDLALQMLRALCAVSQLGVTHRDVKPDNLIFDRSPDGEARLKLVDFGIAQQVERREGEARYLGELVGTPHYMSPEQMRAEEVDVRSDIYSLGVTLYEMLTGRTPHAGETLEEIAQATLFAPIVPVRTLRPDCPEVLERIVLKALARERECRYETASEMRKELERWDATRRALPLAGAMDDLEDEVTEPVAPPAPRVVTRKPPSARRAPSGRATQSVARGLFLAMLAGLAGMGGWTVSRHLRSALRPTLPAAEPAVVAPWVESATLQTPEPAPAAAEVPALVPAVGPVGEALAKPAS